MLTTEEVEKIKSTPFIMTKSDGGLSNRIQVMTSTMYLSQKKHQNCSILMLWNANKHCNGYFYDFFQPIINFHFINESQYEYLLPFSIANYVKYKAASFRNILQHYGIKFQSTLITNRVEKSIVLAFRPVQHLYDQIKLFVKYHSICNISGVHVRRTDLVTSLRSQNKSHMLTNDEVFYEFINKRPILEKVFLMTDNDETQRKYINHFGTNKIIIYKNIQSSVNTFELRHTSLSQAVTEIFIMAHTKLFRGTGMSSMSRFIRQLKGYLNSSVFC